MDDYSIRSTSGYTAAPRVDQGQYTAAANGASGQDFQQMLTAMLLASTLSGSTGSDSPLGGGDMFSPILFSLIERLLNQQQAGFTGLSEAAPTPRGLPVTGTLTQGYQAGHNGLDFGAPVGTPVHATMDGKVVYAGWNDQGYGNLVIVENGAYKTYYAHLSSIPVSVGQAVQANAVIGLSGNTGNSTGPHVHYEVRQDGQPIDPSSFTLK